ncbi:ATP synthase subunit b, mitochondrial-like [Ylistrum balloti]|uniref:ATP synthase subunit b, mitochondrial-like n=1 Tax=Ylistrum balloti TaxID=509963 RepID=UPI002905F333|nr:ATP synthase subunit b, mitochondrial-like [Ylistrum balloti]
MMRLRYIRAGANATKVLLANNPRCVVEQKATGSGKVDPGRVAHRTVNHLRPPIPTLEERVATWKEVSDIFYGPERDLKNFPPVKQIVDPPKTRYVVVPEAFFEALYNKTGILGPYLLLLGTPAYMFSHQIIKHDYEFGVALFVFPALWYLNKKVHLVDAMTNFITAKREVIDSHWYKPIMDFVEDIDNNIEEKKTLIYQQEALEYIYEAKKENVGLQLEIEYRQRLKSLYEDAMRKLDYQVSIASSKKSFEQGHMAKWITQSVYSSITPQLEKQVMNNCLTNLRQLAKSNTAT